MVRSGGVWCVEWAEGSYRLHAQLQVLMRLQVGLVEWARSLEQ